MENNTTEEIVKRNVKRVPRVLTDRYNIDLINKLFEFGGSVMFDMVVFLGCHHMVDLFGENWFTIQDFCKYMGLERSNLQRKLSEEELKDLFGKDKPMYKVITEAGTVEHPIENIFEAALYKLGSENLAFPESANGYTSYKFVQILTNFEIRTNFHTSKKTKRFYSAKLNPKILDGLFHNYNLFELNDYRLLPNKKGYKVFFLHLSQMIFMVKYKLSKGEAPYFTFTVDQLADIFNLDIKQNKARKQKVNTILKTINDCLLVTKFIFEFKPPPGKKWAYVVHFYFPEETLKYFDEKFKAVFTERYYKYLKQLYVSLVKNITGAYDITREVNRMKEDKKEEDLFISWAFSEEHKEEKEALYRSTFFEAFGREPFEMDIKKDIDFSF